MQVDFSPTPIFFIIIGLLIGMFIGWIIGFFDSNNRTSHRIKAAEANAELKTLEAEERIKEAEEKLLHAQSMPVEGSLPVQDDPGLLRLKKEGNRIIVDLDGIPLTEYTSAERKKRLIELISYLRPWVDGAQSQPPPQTTAEALLTPEPPPAVKPIEPFVTRVKKEANAATEFKLLSMVQQIDTVLQKRLAGTPLEKAGIRLQDSPQGGLEVYIGVQKYDAIEDVPDANIKSIIREAIAEWEKKHVPGAG
ncbi:MAG TPA: hypothetical protein PK078_10420 [Anaerolineales bacterium]|nr:hypothetical protein [Anaerolineales bacterium]HNA89484.1 hypothetical protein [Anaerolineales bacterium]HNB36934.1 hypothetical protein [Anaerolineales bacterium]HNC08397.1 hypothetical protein [Anaerolineales bacterium]